MTERRRAIAYIRQSEQRPGEDEKTSLSLRGQEDVFKQWCEQHDALPVAVVADHDLRGDDPSRPGLRELLDVAERERADVVWVLSLSRFARDHILQELTWRDLQKRGVQHLVSQIESGVDDPFFRGIYGLMHAKTKAEMSGHLRSAFARRAKDGGFPLGTTPIGYRRPHRITVTRANGTRYERETGQPSIDPDGADFVRQLAARVLANDPLTVIADDLNRRGPGPRGGRWRPTTIRRILQSPIYAGDIVHHGVVVHHNPEWAILDRETWNRLQQRFARAPVIRRGQIDSWLEGLICHACDDGQTRRMYYGAYTGKSAGHGGSLVCQGQWEKTCRGERRIIGAHLAEEAVTRCLIADLGDMRTSAAAVAMAHAEIGGTAVAKRRADLDQREADAHARWRRSHERYATGVLPWDVMDEEDARLKESLAAIERDRAALPVPPDESAIRAAAARLSTVRALIAAATGDELRGLLTDLGVAIVSADGIVIRYHEPIRHLLPGTLTPVPRWGKGLRSVG